MSIPKYRHVFGELFVVPLPHDSAWLATIRCYRRAPPCEVLEEVEATVGAWRVGMTPKETMAAKHVAISETIPVQIELQERHNEKLGGGLFEKPPADPNAPRITGTLSVVEPRSKL